MGTDSRKAPPLPAPTETDTNTPTELTTDLSKPGDEKSSYSIPEDGTPVTIRTRGHKANRSQTSLLIEYFEGGKSGGSQGSTSRKPSVRVRLTPSKKGKGDHIQVTETKGSRKASLTRRIPLGEGGTSREIQFPDGEDGHSSTSYASATEESNVSRNPIDVEIDRSHRRRRPASPLIPSGETYQPGNPSEISAIPTDSFLDGTGASGDVKRSASPSRGEKFAEEAGAAALAGAAMDEISNRKTRKAGKERVKLNERSSEKSDRKRRSKSRTSSISEQAAEEMHSPRRRSGRGTHDSNLSGADSSILSSNLSPSHRSLDAYSSRSGASKVSINNPKLLETVEDAIRRLILPELSALKREQSKRESRRGSLTSTGTSGSREEFISDRRRSSGQHSDMARDSPRRRERRNREARHDYDDESPRNIAHESLDSQSHEYQSDVATPKRSNSLLKAAAAGAAGAALAEGISSMTDDKYSDERKQRERRRRRTESARSRSLGRERYAEEYDDEEAMPAPPMPLMSDINPSDITRTSILSAETDRPHSASEEFATVHDVSRGLASDKLSPTRSRTPVDLQHTLGTTYANVSHGDLTALPRENREYAEEYETDEFGRKVPIDRYGYEEAGARDMPPEHDEYPEDSYEEAYYHTQDVPPPLKYVPYQAGARGLSPIPSVSTYTEGGSEAPQQRNSRSLHSPSEAASSPNKSPEHIRHSHSAHSLDSIPSNMRSREFDEPLSVDGRSVRSAEDLRHDDGYGADMHESQKVGGQQVRGVGANPNIVHSPWGMESAVASLVDGSMLEQSVLTNASGHDSAAPRDSTLSYEEHSKELSSRGESPEKMSIDSRHDMEEERRGTPGSRSQDVSEYEIDEHGRKVPRSRYRNSPTASEAAITAGAVGAAAAALKAAQERRQAHVQPVIDEEFQPAGVFRNKSFKERAMEGWEPRNTPAHSIDRLEYDEAPQMTASGIPDGKDPMPEIGYLDDDMRSTPSATQERYDRHMETESGRATPTQRHMDEQFEHDDVHAAPSHSKEGGLGLTEVAGAAALGAAAGMAAAHSREPSQGQEEWQRTSAERKRDTLLTNPYEDASPIVNPALNENLLGTRGLGGENYNAAYHTGSPGFGQKFDEGYMSNGPNRTPDIQPVGKALDLAGAAGAMGMDDPFYVPKGDTRHLSGMSHGMNSPFYDAATGAGIERIENKDIVALMQHLMVRDAQRSARDTELVALLMNSAIEMRNSFRDMKEMIQDTGDDVIFANVENTEKLQKAINGPRPYPSAGSRSIKSASQAGTLDSVTKKKNLWRRALEGLGAKGASDLSRIEDMLMQLLGEVDVLKTQTAAAPASMSGPEFENMQAEGQYENDQGYEPEGISTASHASQSGNLAPSSMGRPLAGDRRVSDNRISTVKEEEEEYPYGQPSSAQEHTDPNLLTPSQTNIARGASVPLDTPPQVAMAAQPQPLSAENTPRTDKGRKHKSSSSSGWVPRISRWSATTASSASKAFRGSGKKDSKYDEYQPPSRSGSSLASYDDAYRHDPFGEDKLHPGFSDPNLAAGGLPAAALAPPQPTFMTPEDPKYKAHRNSLNLQHPQPRPGPSQRFQNALETSAHEYDSSMSPKSADWAGSATSINRLPQNTQRYSNTSSTAAREGEFLQMSPNQMSGPPRPPKEPIDSPTMTTPSKARISKLAKGSPSQSQGYEPGYPSGSPRFENRNLSGALGVPTRRPSGPRAMTPKSLEEEAAREERRRKRDTFGSAVSQETDTF